MKLKKITITGLKNMNRRICVCFSELNVSVLYGENGCGKTTLLRLINAILSYDDNALLNESVEEIEIIYEGQEGEKRVKIQKEEVRITNDEESADENDENDVFIMYRYNWEKLKESELAKATSMLFGVNRGITNTITISHEYLHSNIVRSRFATIFRNGNELRDFCYYLCKKINMNQSSMRGLNIKDTFDFSAAVLTVDNIEMNVIEYLLIRGYRRAKQVSVMRVQKALFDTLADACNSINTEESDLVQLKELLSKNKDKLINTLNQIETNTLSEKIITILNEEDVSVIVQECEGNPLLTKLIVNMSMELEKEEGLLQAVKKLKEVFDEYIGPQKSIEIDEDYVKIIFNNSDDYHNITDLSSGEKHLLVLLTLFIIEGRERDILMIDEPEISLNIRWQRKLMPLLSELAPNAQILVASHSPSIAKADTKYLVEMR